MCSSDLLLLVEVGASCWLQPTEKYMGVGASISICSLIDVQLELVEVGASCGL